MLWVRREKGIRVVVWGFGSKVCRAQPPNPKLRNTGALDILLEGIRLEPQVLSSETANPELENP